VVAVRLRGCVTASAARAGETDTVMTLGLTVNFSVTLFVRAVVLESLTVNVIGVAVAVAVGVPEMAPVDASVRPAGSAPELVAQDRGALPPLAVSVAA
jgi:hypothetical protein